METQATAPAPVAAPTPSAPRAESSMSANNIIVTLFTGIITGFAIGLGLILSQKVTKKNVMVESKSDTSSANGMPMYPPRQPMRPPMRPPMGYGNPYGLPQSGNPYMQAVGSQHKFDPNFWLSSNRENELLANAPD